MFSLNLNDIVKMVVFFSDILLGKAFGHFVRNVLYPISYGTKPLEFGKIDIILEEDKIHKVRECFGSYLKEGDYSVVEEYKKHIFELKYLTNVKLIIHITDKLPKTIFEEDMIFYHDGELINGCNFDNIINRKLTLTKYYQRKIDSKSIDFVKEENWYIFMYDNKLVNLIIKYNNIRHNINMLQKRSIC